MSPVGGPWRTDYAETLIRLAEVEARLVAYERALKMAYPYVKDAWDELPPGPVRKIVEDDLEVIAPLVRVAALSAQEGEQP